MKVTIDRWPSSIMTLAFQELFLLPTDSRHFEVMETPPNYSTVELRVRAVCGTTGHKCCSCIPFGGPHWSAAAASGSGYTGKITVKFYWPSSNKTGLWDITCLLMEIR